MTAEPAEVRAREFRGVAYKYGVYNVLDYGNSSYYTHEVAELDIREKFWKPKAGDVVVDVGAQFGSYTLPAAALGAYVLAFEPLKMFVECLEKNVELNGFQDRVIVYNYALSDANANFSYPPAGHPDHHRYTFPGRRLDDVAEELGLFRLDWVKCDTEGWEPRVLRGATRTIARCHPKMLLEVHKFLDGHGDPPQEEQIVPQLKALGYTWERHVDSPVDYIFAQPP